MPDETPDEAPLGPTRTDDPDAERVREDGDYLDVDPTETADTIGADANGA